MGKASRLRLAKADTEDATNETPQTSVLDAADLDYLRKVYQDATEAQAAVRWALRASEPSKNAYESVIAHLRDKHKLGAQDTIDIQTGAITRKAE